ncbi:MAG TPA: RDD family protein [Acidimicrobiales bacterium]|nr:RDD family protein [Acidimicrobiales bacterium]
MAITDLEAPVDTTVVAPPTDRGEPPTGHGEPRRRAAARRPLAHDPSVAPLWRRAVARGIDMVAVFVWMWMLSILHVLFHLPMWSDAVDPGPWGTSFLAVMTYVVLLGAYEIGFIAHTGATPGKDAMGLRVVRDGTDLAPTLGQSARRFLLPGTAQLLPGVWLGAGLAAGYGATALTDVRRRAVHDRIAGTQVVIATQRPVPTAPVRFPDGYELRLQGQHLVEGERSPVA